MIPEFLFPRSSLAVPRVLLVSTPGDRAACLALRERVFVREQGVPFDLEMDALDDLAAHFLVRDPVTHVPLATARLLEKEAAAKIGRVAVVPEARGRGLGRDLMEAVLIEAGRRGFATAVLDAQTAVVGFYRKLGFVAEGEEFLEAGIPHVTMRRPLSAP